MVESFDLDDLRFGKGDRDGAFQEVLDTTLREATFEPRS